MDADLSSKWFEEGEHLHEREDAAEIEAAPADRPLKRLSVSLAAIAVFACLLLGIARFLA